MASIELRRKPLGGATKRATDALILARTGREPKRDRADVDRNTHLSWQDSGIKNLREDFREAIRDLHGNCFYLGDRGQPGVVGRMIRDTADYIRHATELADS